MDLIALLIGLVFLVMLFLPWINAFRLESIKDELRGLRRDVRSLQTHFAYLERGIKTGKDEEPAPARAPAPAPQRREEPTAAIPVEGRAQKAKASPVPRIEMDQIQQKISSFEQNIGTKLPVWLGAISLICAAFFLVKYSIDAGWLGPVMRVSLGGIFGAGLLAAGQWIIRRPHIANAERIAQGLVGAGLVSLYVSLYAAINLYGLLPPLAGFVSMTIVTALAVIMSLRHGQPIAAFGLLGGLLTPALVGSEEPNALALFTYLFLLFSGMFFILTRKGWWILAVVALVGVFCWSAFWYVVAFATSDALVLVLFAMAVTGVVLAITGKYVTEQESSLADRRPIHALNFVAIAGGVLTIGWLSLEITLTLFDWAMLGLLSLAMMGMAYFQPSVYQKPLWAKLCASLILFGIWAQDAPLANAVTVVMGMAALYGGIPAWLMRQVNDPRFWAGVQCVGAVSLYILSYCVLALPASFTDPFAGFWGILGLVLASLSVWQAADIRGKFTADEIIQSHLIAFYSLAATAFISCGLSIELQREYLPLGFAGQIAATAWIYQRTGIDFLKKIIIILVAIFACLNYEQLMLFSNLLISAILDSQAGREYFHYAVLDVPLIKLGIPAALIGYAALVAIKADRADEKLAQILFGAFFLTSAATLYYLGRGALHGNYVETFTTRAGFVERGIITMIFAASGMSFLRLSERFNFAFLKPWGIGLIHFAMARLVYFDLLLHNPVLAADQLVGGWPVLNGVTLTYGAGALLASRVVYSPYFKGAIKTFYKALSFALLFLFASFTVRQYFHGSALAAGPTSSAELYGYSAAWLLTGLALLAIGIRNQNKTARIASLVFMLLAVGKVFLFDAAALEGLYRVFSFLGLGMSLIGLSYFYTKFVFAKNKGKQGASE